MYQISSQSDELCRKLTPPPEASCNYFFFKASRVKASAIYDVSDECQCVAIRGDVPKFIYWYILGFKILGLRVCFRERNFFLWLSIFRVVFKDFRRSSLSFLSQSTPPSPGHGRPCWCCTGQTGSTVSITP